MDARPCQSLLYHIRAWSSVALLVCVPPILVIFGTPLPFLIGILAGNTPFRVASLLVVGPLSPGGILIWDRFLIFLGHILTLSAFGERHTPRPPNLLDDNVFRTLGL